MGEDDLAQEIELGLKDVHHTLEDLQNRMLAGEDVDEKELTMLARMVATQMEMLRSKMLEVLGPLPREELLSQLREQMTPDEYEEFLSTEKERDAFRDEIRREETIREQLGDADENDG